MPNNKSAEKRLRSSMRRRGINRVRISRIKTAEKRLEACIEAGNGDEAKSALSICFSELDKAAQRGTMHKNKANRRKQRLAAAVAKLD